MSDAAIVGPAGEAAELTEGEDSPMTTMTTAADQYARRPKDERYPSPQAMIAAAEHDRTYSREITYNTRDLTVVAAGTHNTADFQPTPDQASLVLRSPKGVASFTHWSFGQLCRMVGAPASYLRELPPAIAADALNFGLKDSAAHATDAKLLVKANGCAPIVRACTSETYGRIWDAELYGATLETLGRNGDDWQTPPTWSGEPAGAYRGDRDSFLILVNGGSIVTDPSLSSSPTQARANTGNGGGDGPVNGMFRGIMIRNSEVGHCSVTIDTVLYRYICGNHMLWGAMFDQRFKRRHVGDHARRDALRTIYNVARSWSTQSAAADEALIKSLISRELAHTKDAVVDELRKMGATRNVAIAAYERTEQTESASPRSFWGLAQGLTRVSQDAGYQDGRLELDQLAASLLARGRKLVAA